MIRYLHHRPAIVLLALGLMLGAASCSRESGQEREVRIGVITPRTSLTASGVPNNNAQSTRRAADIAVQEVNTAGGLMVGGRRYKVILAVEDDRDNAEGAVNAARKLISQEGVAAIIGPQVSRKAIRAGEVAENARVPLISPVSTNPLTTVGRKYVFRVAFTDEFQGKVLARFAREELHAKRAAVLYDVSNEYNRYMASMFRQAFEAAGGRVVSQETYTSDHTEGFRTQLTRIRRSRPEILFLPNFPGNVITQAREARRLGIEATLLGADSWDPKSFLPYHEFDGAYLTDHWHPAVANKEARAFIAVYQERYGELPTTVAALTYDAFGLLFQAIRRRGAIDPEAIRDGLSVTQGYRGVTGVISYQGGGDPTKPAIILQIRAGRIELYKVISP